MKKKLAVIALGGNALLRGNETGTIDQQEKNTFDTCKQLVDLIKKDYNIIITHGNGPQVGNILLRNEAGFDKYKIPQMPMDICVADSQGGIGYMIERMMRNVLNEEKIKKDVVTLVTQVLVNKHDPAFENPTKPVGKFYTESEAKDRMAKEKWTMVEDAGRGWRRVVPSPKPARIIESRAIKNLVQEDVVVIAVGGGGIPVIADVNGNLSGVAAVIDKDLASAVLAKEIGADLLVISTAVEKVYLNFGKPGEKPIDRMTVAEAKNYVREGHFKPGSMLPKIQSLIDFLEGGGKEGLVTDPQHIPLALEGKTGTWLVP